MAIAVAFPSHRTNIKIFTGFTNMQIPRALIHASRPHTQVIIWATVNHGAVPHLPVPCLTYALDWVGTPTIAALNTCAGSPSTLAPSGTDLITNAPAPITALFPMTMPAMITAPDPTITPFPNFGPCEPWKA